MNRSLRDLAMRLLALMALSLVAATIAAWCHPHLPSWDADDPGPGEVRLREALAWDRPLWIDARTRDAYAKGHVPGALLLTEERWSRDLEAVVNAWRPGQRLVVYCDGRSCDAALRTARRLRREADLDQVWVLRGGWDAWRRAQP